MTVTAKDVYRYLQKVGSDSKSPTSIIETHKEFNLGLAVKHHTITNGLKYSPATGNWGGQKKSMSSKTGVSQVLNRYTYASTLIVHRDSRGGNRQLERGFPRRSHLNLTPQQCPRRPSHPHYQVIVLLDQHHAI